jgi:hypothetical protein
MIIRVDKCSTFGIIKALTKSVQYLPKLIINKSIIPAIENGKSFCYLGRYFNYEMTNNEHKSELVSLLTDLMKEIHRSEAITSEKQDSPLQSLRSFKTLMAFHYSINSKNVDFRKPGLSFQTMHSLMA